MEPPDEKVIRGDKSEEACIAQARELPPNLELVKAEADNFAAGLEEAAKQFTDEELRRVRNKEPFTAEMISVTRLKSQFAPHSFCAA